MEDEEIILPKEIESFCLMKSTLIEALKEYSNKNKSKTISDFVVAIQKYLEDFGNGVEGDEWFNFEVGSENSNKYISYINYDFEPGMIQISSGGYVCDCGDSYTDWMYSIWLDGWIDNNYDFDFSKVNELVSSGGKLDIYSPDDYIE